MESSGVERTRRPVADMSADGLERELVADLVAGYHTPLARFVPAIIRISSERRCTPEAAYQRVRSEALERGARPSLLFPGPR